MSAESTPSELRPLATTLNATFGRLETAFQRQKRFTADASHELRTPLSVMRTQIDVALSHERSPEAYREALRACQRAASRMSGVVDGLLCLARTDGDEHVDAGTAVDLALLVLETVELLRPEAERRQVALAHALDPVTVHGHSHRLGIVVSNLVVNAIEHNHPGGDVQVRLSRSAGQARLSVRDTGVGIPREALPLVFEPFYRVDAARSRDRGGTGLGLAIVQSIVEAHGGSVAVESVEGAGSTFAVTLPALGSGPGDPGPRA